MTYRRSGSATALGALVAGIAGFQGALAAGAPWGRVAWGGTNPGTLPAGYRVASGVTACVWLAVAAAVLVSPRIAPIGRRRLATGLVVVSVVAVIANGASRSTPERAVWTPYALVMLGCAALLRRELRAAEGSSANQAAASP